MEFIENNSKHTNANYLKIEIPKHAHAQNTHILKYAAQDTPVRT